MSQRRADRLQAAGVVSHLGVMVAVAAVMGLLVAGLALPFAAITGLSSRSLADSTSKLPSNLATDPLAQRTTIRAKDGSVLATLFDQNRIDVKLADVSPTMRKAIVSIEDYRFYQHGALDLRGTMRAFVTNKTSGGVTQGGSSITQQMVKMTLVNQAKTKSEQAAATADTYARKLAELRYAIAFEGRYSKDWILQRYLNIAYFGDGAYGIEAAARHYFSTTAKRLNLRQSAVLAGLVKNPTGYDPTNYPAAARKRRNVVIARMAQLKVIPAATARRAEARALGLQVTKVSNGCVSSAAPFFCDYALQYLLTDKSLGRTVEQRRRLLLTGGLTIKTTLDPRFQTAADRSVSSHVYATDQAIGGLAMVVPGTGEVRALSQSRPMGRDAAAGETYLNYVVPNEYGDSAGFQAGSTFKPFVLASAVNQGIPLSTTINAPPTYTIPKYTFKNCSDQSVGDEWTIHNSTGSGRFNLYTGTQKSVNTFYAQLEARTGLCEPVTLARKMGVTVPDRDVVGPFVLGSTNSNPLTMAGVYATYAARGVYCEPQPVTQVLNGAGKVVADYPRKCSQVLPTATADAVNAVLKGVQEPGGFGYGAGLGLAQQSAGKTGTTTDNQAVWFDGYTPDLATSAMIAGANSSGQPEQLNGKSVAGRTVYGAAGSTFAGPIWGDAMKAVQQYLPDETFTAPNAQAVAGQGATIPSLYGESPQQAAADLREAGFNPIVGSTVSSSSSPGSVAYLSPGSGTAAPAGSTVTIYVSDGSPGAGGPGNGRRGNGGRR